MPSLEKILNRKIVRRIFDYYTTRGEARIDEFFGAEKEYSPGAVLGRLPIQIALNTAMKKMAVTEEMKAKFLGMSPNRQTLKNLMKTVAKNGMKQPFRFDGPFVVVWNITNLCNLRCRYCYQSAGKPGQDELSFEMYQSIALPASAQKISGSEMLSEKMSSYFIPCPRL